ncbi:MAG: glycosyltransferase family 2 protein, partial [Arcobacteraceae bacterium]
MIENITPVIIAKDASATIGKTLESLKSFKEIVIYLNNSSDDTKKIVQQYSNSNLIEGEFLGFGPTKNKAASYSPTKWVLSLDADEVLSDEFIVQLSKIDLDSNCLYKILRTNYYKKKQIKHCWGDDLIVRLYDISQTKFCNNKVHEYIEEKDFKVIQLDGIVEHYPYNSITDFIIKLDRYSTIFANDNVG